MDWNFIWTVLGVLATVLFGIWAVYLAFTTAKKVQITFSCEKCVSLLHEFSKGIPDLQIRYRDKPIGDNILLLRAYLINTGNKDVTPDMVENKIKLSIPKEFSFVEINLTEMAPMLKSSISIINDQTIEFNTGLWKSKEYLKFDALISVQVERLDKSNDKNKDLPLNIMLKDQISFQHRIADSSKINNVWFPPGYSTKDKNKKQLVPLAFFKISLLIMSIIIIGIGIFAYNLSTFGLSNEFVYKIKIANKELFVNAWPKKNIVFIKGDSLPKQKITLHDFQNAYLGEVKIVQFKRPVSKTFGVIYIIMGFFIIILLMYRQIRENKILKFIRQCSKDN